MPIGIAVALLAPVFLGESARNKGGFDLPGALGGTFGLTSLVYGLTRAADDETGWGDPLTLTFILGGAALILGFLAIEYVSRHPLMPFRILANRTRAVSFLVMLIVGAAMFAMFYFLGIYIQVVLGYGPLQAGFAFLPFSFGIVAAAQIASTLMSRVDPRWIAGVGAVLTAAGMWGFSLLETDSQYLTHLLPWILVLSFGMGLVFVPLTLTAVSGVDKQDSGVGSAVLNTMQQVGGALGLAVLTTVSTTLATDKSTELVAAAQANAPAGVQPTQEQIQAAMEQIGITAMTHGFTRAFLVAAAMALGAALITVIGLSVRHEEVAAEGAAPGASVG